MDKSTSFAKMTVIPKNRFVVAVGASPSTSTTTPTVKAKTNKVKTVTASGTVVRPSVVKTSGAAHAMALDNAVAFKVFTPVFIKTLPGINPLFPDVSTRKGNLFNDRFDKNTLWYLPEFKLLAGTDDSFSFTATKSALPDQSGDPFYIADLKFTVTKEIPADVTAARAQNAVLALKEIVLQSLQITLSIAFTGSNGQKTTATYSGTISLNDNGSYEVHIGNIIGSHAVILYENLKISGSAQIFFSAIYAGWQPAGVSGKFFIGNNLAIKKLRPGIPTVSPLFKKNTFTTLQPVQPPKTKGGFIENQTFYEPVDLSKKFSSNDYQLDYKVISDDVARPIISIDDLKDLKGNPTEFSELKTIDLSKYPSINSLYIGVLSRVIVIIPRSYGIVRNAVSCSASCMASVDSTPGGGDSCVFQFQFELTPAVDKVDFEMLFKEIQQDSDLQSYTLKFAERLDENNPSKINSVFTTGTSFNPAAASPNFYLAVVITDKPGQSAIVNANLFIQQLCKATPGCALGTISLKLDDNYPRPVTSTVTLSLPSAVSEEGISWSIDEEKQTIVLTNTTSFDFLLQRYTFCSDAGIGDAVVANISIAGGESADIPLPQDFVHLSIILDYVEQSDGVNRSNLSRYMEIKTQDAQNVQYMLGIDTSQVKYATRNIKQIDIQTHITNNSEVVVPSFSLMKQNTLASTNIMLPLQFAITTLPANINFIVSFSDTAKPSVSFSKQNDFIINPVFDVLDADLPP